MTCLTKKNKQKCTISFQKDRRDETGSFTFNYSIADCVGDGKKEEEREMKRGERARQLL